MTPRAEYPFPRHRRHREPGWTTYTCRLCGSEDYAGRGSQGLADGRCVDCAISGVTGFALRHCPRHGMFEAWVSDKEGCGSAARNPDGTIGHCPGCREEAPRTPQRSWVRHKPLLWALLSLTLIIVVLQLHLVPWIRLRWFSYSVAGLFLLMGLKGVSLVLVPIWISRDPRERWWVLVPLTALLPMSLFGLESALSKVYAVLAAFGVGLAAVWVARHAPFRWVWAPMLVAAGAVLASPGIHWPGSREFVLGGDLISWIGWALVILGIFLLVRGRERRKTVRVPALPGGPCPLHGHLGLLGSCDLCRGEGKNIVHCREHGYTHVEANNCLLCAGKGILSGEVILEATAPNPHNGHWPEVSLPRPR